MSIILVVFFLCFITAIGYSIIKFFNLLPQRPMLELLCYAYGLGVGLIAFQLFIYSRLGIEWSIIFLLSPWIIMKLIFFALNYNFMISKKKLSFNFSLINKSILILIFSLLIFVGFESVLRPLSAWDGWANWLLKAKVFYIDGFINPEIFTYIESDYPLVISLMSTFIYVVLGKVDDKLVLLSFFMFYFVMSGVFFFSLRRYVGDTKALIFTFLLMSLQNLIRHGGRFEAGQADLTLGYYILAGSLLLKEYLSQRNYKTLILLYLFLGITGLIKNEGLPFVLLIQGIILFFIFKFKLYRHLFFSLLWLLPVLEWQIFKYLNYVPQNYLFTNFSINFNKAFVNFYEIGREFLNIQNWNILWIVFFIGFLLFLFKKSKRFNLIFYIIIFTQLVGYYLVFLATPVDSVLHIRNVIDRLLIHVAPLAVFTTAISIFSAKEEKI